MNESAGEARFIKALRESGYFASHITCGVNGFSDILAIKGSRSYLLEVKDIRRKDRFLRSIFESTQPQFYFNLSMVGFANSFLLMADESKDYFVLYRITHLLPLLLENPRARLEDMSGCVDGTAADVIRYMEKLWV